MEAWQWGAVIIPVALALVGAIWLLFRAKVERTEGRLDEHIKEDIAVHERTAVLESQVERNTAEIGERDSGIRGELHQHASVLTQHELRITMLEKK